MNRAFLGKDEIEQDLHKRLGIRNKVIRMVLLILTIIWVLADMER